MTDRNLAAVDDLCEAFNAHDIDRILGHFAEDSVWLLSRGTPPDGRTLRGKNEIRGMLEQRFGSIPDMQWDVIRNWGTGNNYCSEWTVTGTEPNGSKLNWLGCDLWTFNADGRVTRKDTYWKYAGGES